MSTTFTVSQLADILQLSYQGDDITIHGVNTLEKATEHELSFLANPKYIKQLDNTNAGAVIVHPEQSSKVKNAIIAPDPYTAFAKCIALFAPKEGTFEGISSFASIAPEAEIGENCTIYPFVYIGAKTKIGNNCTLFAGTYIGEDCRIGNNCTLFPNSVLMARTQIGENCTLQAGAVLGSAGFGFARTKNGIQKIPQVGHVIMGDNVEIGANTTIDKAALAVTSIGSGTCMDNLVQIGHNVQTGNDCLIIAQAGIAGSTVLGDNCTIAGQAGLSGHLDIGDNVTIGPQAGIAKNIPANQIVGGSPATDYTNFLRISTLMPRLPEIYKRLVQVEKQLERLNTNDSNNNEKE